MKLGVDDPVFEDAEVEIFFPLGLIVACSTAPRDHLGNQ